MRNLWQFRVKFLSWPCRRDQIPNLEPLRLTSPHLQVPGPATLSGLAAELLLSIADFLPPEDIYSLSLCNHRFFATFENWRKREKLENKSRLSFLSRLERDNPEYFTCYVCYILHKYDCGSKSFGLSGPIVQQICLPRFPCMRTQNGQFIPELMMCMNSKYSKSYAENELCFIHLQLAMRHHYYGPQYGIDPFVLSFTGVTVHITSTALHSLEAQICLDSGSPVLCLRIQDIISVMHLRADRLVSDKDQSVPPQVLQICAHIDAPDLLFWINDFVKAYCARRTLSLFRMTCEKCNTEYQLELREYGKDNLALLITRWINLGPGLSPNDPQWRVHSSKSQGDLLVLDSKYMLSSPRSMFEDSPDISFEALCTRNLLYLSDRRYRSEMGRICKSPPSWAVWYEPA